MCGLLGMISLSGKSLPESCSARYLKNRGPDGQSCWRSAEALFVHARLAVIDRQGSSMQPIENNDCVLICNGEVYNHREIRKMGGYVYSGTSDCEAILHLYSLYGSDGFGLLDGAFAFALFDKKARKVFIHRDNIGKKPLFLLYKKAETLIFSSELTAIADNYPGKLVLDNRQIDYYFKYGHLPWNATLLEEVVPVLPGEIYEVDLGGKEVFRRKLKKACVDYREHDFNDVPLIQKTIERLLDAAIAKRMQKVDSPVLLFSGGIDSTVLACRMLAHNASTELVSLRQPLWFMHDQPCVDKASQLLKKQVHFVRLERDFLRSHIDGFILSADQPLAVCSYYFLSALSLKAGEFGRVLFTGDGGDEAFLGYASLKDWLLACPDGSAATEAVCGPPLPSYFSEYARRAVGEDLVGHGFIKVDKAISENQMEARCPYLDWELLCFMRSLPLVYWKNAPAAKWALKNILIAAGFPPSFVHRRKRGFSFPFRYLMFPFFKEMIKYIYKEREVLNGHFRLAKNKISPLEFFIDFDRYWKVYVFIKYCRNYGNLFQLCRLP